MRYKDERNMQCDIILGCCFSVVDIMFEPHVVVMSILILNCSHFELWKSKYTLIDYQHSKRAYGQVDENR